jgi:hypothetical protein
VQGILDEEKGVCVIQKRQSTLEREIEESFIRRELK